ncbi:hypothetical protein [Lacunimicrobium album]
MCISAWGTYGAGVGMPGAGEQMSAYSRIALTLIRPSGTFPEEDYRVVHSRLLGESELLASTSREKEHNIAPLDGEAVFDMLTNQNRISLPVMRNKEKKQFHKLPLAGFTKADKPPLTAGTRMSPHALAG